MSFLPCRTQVFAGCLPEMARAIKRWNCKACSVFKRLSHNPPFSRGGKHFCSPEGRRIQNEHKKSLSSLEVTSTGAIRTPVGRQELGKACFPQPSLVARGPLARLTPFWSTRLQAGGRATVRPSGPALYTCRFSLSIKSTPAPVYMFLNRGNPSSKAAWNALC